MIPFCIPFVDFHVSTMGTSGQVGTEINITANMDPPLSALANTPSSDPWRYNVIEGGVFTINCSVTFTEPYSVAVVEFYKDFSVVQNEISYESGMDVVSVLNFSDFQSSNNGLYYCFVTVFSDNSSYISINHRAYHTGEANLQENAWYTCMYFPITVHVGVSTYRYVLCCMYVYVHSFVL